MEFLHNFANLIPEIMNYLYCILNFSWKNTHFKIKTEYNLYFNCFSSWDQSLTYVPIQDLIRVRILFIKIDIVVSQNSCDRKEALKII